MLPLCGVSFFFTPMWASLKSIAPQVPSNLFQSLSMTNLNDTTSEREKEREREGEKKRPSVVGYSARRSLMRNCIIDSYNNKVANISNLVFALGGFWA